LCLTSLSRIIYSYFLEYIGYLRPFYRGDDIQELYILDCLDIELLVEMFFQKFLGYLYEADTRGNWLSWEMGLIDEMVGIQQDVITQGGLYDVL
jgi:hypothetical protein